MLHLLLKRQLNNLELSRERMPASLPEWQEFLASVSRAYQSADQDRYLLERSLTISSKEMLERWQHLQELEAHWRSLVDCVPDVILTIDPNGKVLFCNQDIGGLAKESLVGLHFTEWVDSEQAILFKERLAQVIEGGGTRTFKIQTQGRQGKPLWLDCRIGPIRRNDRVIAGVVVATDVTKTLELQSELEIQRMKSIEASKMASLGEMAGGIAHEINNPLATIQFLAEQLEDIAAAAGAQSDSIIGISRKIVGTTERITKIVKSFRQFARNGSNDPYVESSLLDIVNDTLDLCHEKLRRNSIRVEVQIDPAIRMYCQPVQISQVLLNLISNSSDAVESLSEKWIKIAAQCHSKEVRISITDSGKGIPAEIQHKLQQPFFTTKPVGRGTGLGLSLSGSIIRQHQGQLWLNIESPNTEFIITLPLRR